MTTQTLQRMTHATKVKGKKMVPTMVKMEPQLRDTLQRLADEQGMTLSAYLRRVYQEHVCFSKAA
jgi:predicted DNA-binding ribbon-helix-helix protein